MACCRARILKHSGIFTSKINQMSTESSFLSKATYTAQWGFSAPGSTFLGLIRPESCVFLERTSSGVIYSREVSTAHEYRFPSGYFGGWIDTMIQRIVEFLLSIPTLPLWMGLSAALPPQWPPLRVYFGITIVLSLVGWCGLARVVRGKLLETRTSDFVLAAKFSGATDGVIIRRHLLPSFISYLIVHLSLAIPHMILGETVLSFLGLGLRAPIVSWGVLLKNAQNFRTIATSPWLMIPILFVVVTVMAFNFLGDGLRDAADPYT
jgi:ABC-type dipeptide/oligopeptide/nickel transport system permease subunit